jgi:hypothetical protein
MNTQDIKGYLHYLVKEGYIDPEDLKGKTSRQVKVMVEQLVEKGDYYANTVGKYE